MAPSHRQLGRPGGWGNRDFHDEVPPRRRFLARGPTAAVVCVLTFVVMIAAVQHESRDCLWACRDGDGILAREPGHPWTYYQDSWQWQAQWLIGIGSLGLALLALATSTRHRLRRVTTACNIAALLLAAGWIAWVLLEPALPS